MWTVSYVADHYVKPLPSKYMIKTTKPSFKQLQTRVQKLVVERKELIEELKVLEAYVVRSKSKQEKEEIDQLLKKVS